MQRKTIYLLSLLLLLSLTTRQTNAAFPFLQDSGPDGIVSMEAENFENNVPQGFHTWTLVNSPAGACGSKAMQALPNLGFKFRDDYITLSPRLDFKISFAKTGTHYIWVRANANGSGSDDSCHAGLDNQANTTSNRISFNGTADWAWFNARENNAGLATFDVANAGVHSVNIWMQEDGAIIDKIVLTTNPAYVPSGEGPQESITDNYLSVDDFEYYDGTANLIFQTWIPDNGTGATIGRPNPPYVEQTIVYSGRQAMPYYYDNSRIGKAYYSEAQADTAKLQIGQDWTKDGVKALTIYFYGDPDNDANVTERMYAALEDSGGHIAVVTYDGNASDIQKKSWQEWNIELKKFTVVDLTNVTKLSLGFGDRYSHLKPGGKGIIFFDDIRLHPPKCVPARAKPAGDINNDCIVDYADLWIMADNWLRICQEADVYRDGKVAFTDFTILANTWLEELLWPQ
jgi:hypothetical protein